MRGREREDSSERQVREIDNDSLRRGKTVRDRQRDRLRGERESECVGVREKE